MKIKLKNKKIYLYSTLGIFSLSAPLLFLSCKQENNNQSLNTGVKENLNINEFNITGTIEDNKTKFTKEWVFNNKEKLFTGDISYLKNVNQIEKISLVEQENVLVINVTLAANTIFENGVLNNESKTLQVKISGFSITPNLMPTESKKDVFAKDLGLSGKSYDNINTFTKQFILLNKDKLFNGWTYEFNNVSQIIELIVKIDEANDSNIKIEITIEAGKTIGLDRKPTTSNTKYTIIVQGFETNNPIEYIPTTPKLDLTASIFNFAGTVAKNKPLINKQWIFENKSKIFNGNTDLIQSDQDIISFTILSNESQEQTMIIRISFKAGTTIDENKEPTINDKEYTINILGFEKEYQQTEFLSLNANELNLSGSSLSNKNKNLLIEGENSYLNNESQIISLNAEVISYKNVSGIKKLRITITLSEGSYIDNFGMIATKAGNFQFIIDKFDLPKETKTKTNIKANDFGFSGTIGDNITTITNSSWFVENKNLFFDGETSLLNLDKIKTYNTPFKEENETSLSIDLVLYSSALIESNGLLNTSGDQTITLNISCFEQNVKDIDSPPYFYIASHKLYMDEDLGITMTGPAENNTHYFTRESIYKIKSTLFGGNFIKYIVSPYQIEYVSAKPNDIQFWEGLPPVDPKTQMRVDVVFSKNAIANDEDNWQPIDSYVTFTIIIYEFDTQ